MTTLLKKRRPAIPTPRRINAAIPLLLLLLALSTVYLFGNDWGHFRRHLPSHDGDSAKNLALAENLSPNHNFRLFLRLYPGPDGAPAYEMYSRFPIGSYALIKLAIAPFGDRLAAQLHAARILMLLMFAAAAALAYQSLRRITARPAIALTATLLAFSSYYILFYNDMIANEIIMDLFAVMLVFHGMTVFIQEKRFPQLLIKTAIAILIGWHVYALLLPFIALGLTQELIRAAKQPHPLTAPPLARLRYIAKKFLTSRYLTLGIAAALFGLAVLTFNLANEYTAHHGNVPLRQLPSAQSILKRIGQDPQYNAAQIDALEWRRFLPGQFRRIGRMTLPYALTAHTNGLHGFHPPGKIPLPYLPIGLAALAACLAGLLLTPRHRLLLTTLALSGIAWAILVRHNTAVHNYESVFYIGIPLTLFTLILWQTQQQRSRRIPQWRSRRIPQWRSRPIPQWRSRPIPQWTRRIPQWTRRIPQWTRRTPQRSRRIPQWSRRTPQWSRPIPQWTRRIPQWSRPIPRCARHIPQCARPLTTAAAAIALLTFTLSAHQMSRTDAQTQTPETQAALMSDFQTIRQLTRNHTVYIPAAELAPVLSWQGAPAIPPPTDPRTYPITESLLNYYFAGSIIQIENKLLYACGPQCAQTYDFAVSLERRETPALRTPNNRLVFLYDTKGIAPMQQAQYRQILSQPPTARAEFNLYLSNHQIAYHKQPCAESDTKERFFLHLYPADPANLPANRQQHGFDNIGFNFHQRGAILDGKCLATVPLPNYDLTRIRTGQWIRNHGETWQTEIPPNKIPPSPTP